MEKHHSFFLVLIVIFSAFSLVFSLITLGQLHSLPVALIAPGEIRVVEPAATIATHAAEVTPSPVATRSAKVKKASPTPSPITQ